MLMGKPFVYKKERHDLEEAEVVVDLVENKTN